MSKYDGGSAFPISDTHHPNGQVQYGCSGMTLRDYFASKAMQGFAADESMGTAIATDIAKLAYQLADAMIAERTK